MIVYKILNHEMKSLCANFSCQLYRVAIQYSYNKKISTNDNSKLFAFKTLEDAKNWLKLLPFYNRHSCFIYKAEAENIGYPKKILHPAKVSALIYFRDFWQQKKNKKKLYRTKSVPKGTVSCDSLTILEKI